jgi:hypothetical protein
MVPNWSGSAVGPSRGGWLARLRESPTGAKCAALCMLALLLPIVPSSAAAPASAVRRDQDRSEGSQAGSVGGAHRRRRLGEGRGVRCGTLRVPVNYSEARRRSVSPALSELLTTSKGSLFLGVLVVDPGGPGAPGLARPAQVAAPLGPAVAGSYTIVAFDPREVGLPTPALQCGGLLFFEDEPNFVPRLVR